MFHAPMGRFQLELIYYFTYFSPLSHLTLVRFFPVGLSLLIQHFEQTPTRPVENVVLTMKGLQERNTTVRWDDGGK